MDYGGEIWGIYDWEELERTHLFACKHILNVNMNTAADAIYAETGRTPLVAKRHVAAIKFVIRLNTLSSDKLSRKAYKLLVFDSANGHYNWISLMTELFRRYKIEVSGSNFIIKKKIKSYFEESLKKKLTTAISEQKKLRTYSSFKTVLKFEPYL